MAQQWEYLIYVHHSSPYIQEWTMKEYNSSSPVDYVVANGGGPFKKGLFNGPSEHDVISFILKSGWEPFQTGEDSYHFRRRVES